MHLLEQTSQHWQPLTTAGDFGLRRKSLNKRNVGLFCVSAIFSHGWLHISPSFRELQYGITWKSISSCSSSLLNVRLKVWGHPQSMTWYHCSQFPCQKSCCCNDYSWNIPGFENEAVVFSFNSGVGARVCMSITRNLWMFGQSAGYVTYLLSFATSALYRPEQSSYLQQKISVFGQSIGCRFSFPTIDSWWRDWSGWTEHRILPLSGGSATTYGPLIIRRSMTILSVLQYCYNYSYSGQRHNINTYTHLTRNARQGLQHD